MQESRNRFLSFFALACLIFAGLLPGRLNAQTKVSFKVTGPCMSCGEERMLEIVKGMDGVKAVQFEAGQSMLNIEFDQATASVIDIQLELSLKGYDAGDFNHDAATPLPACAKMGAAIGMRGESTSQMALSDDLPVPGIDDLEDTKEDTDWENPRSFEIVDNSSDDFEDIDLMDDEMEDVDDLLEWANDDSDDE